jgi:sugar (pentulose or hexulose) kinase
MGEILRCIYQSLAFKYRYTVEALEEISNKEIPAIHMIGGGIKDELLCKMTADFCRKTVKAGPVEATVIGNTAVQMMYSGIFKDLSDARKVIAESFPIKTYTPSENFDGEAAYQEFKKYIGK